MIDKPKSYFYKEVEAAFSRFKGVCSGMLPTVEGLNLPDVDVIKSIANIQGYLWSKHPSVIELNLPESELTDEQKENIALSNKVEFDAAISELNEICNLWNSLLTTSDNAMNANRTISKVIFDSVKDQLFYDYNGVVREEYDATPLVLTAEELYWALTLLDSEKARLVLSEQTPLIFDSLYNAYQKGKEDFIYAFSNQNSTAIKGLRIALFTSINDMDSFLDFCEAQLLENKRLLSIFADEILEIDDDYFSGILNYILFGEPLCELDNANILTWYGQKAGNAIATIENIEGLTRFDKKKIQNIKETLSNNFPHLQTGQIESISLSPKMVNVITSLMDKWLLLKIHERAKVNSIEAQVVDMEEETQKISFAFQNPIVSTRLEFPTRLISQTNPSPISAQEQEHVLREIYNLYGGSFEDMSCEEFFYLFGAAFVKQPASYNPPYYWVGSESSMKALLRILYTQQPRLVKELILHISDKETSAKSHDWGRNKNRVTYRDIEASIIKIVHGVTGKTLKEL